MNTHPPKSPQQTCTEPSPRLVLERSEGAKRRESERDPAQRAVTLRAILLGVVLVALLATGAHYSRHILHSTKLAQDHLSLGVVFPFFVLTVIVNKIIARITPGRALRANELIVIFSMGLIGSTLPTYFLGKLIANIAAPHYFATPENRWAEYTHQYIPDWAAVKSGKALTWFFEGLPDGESIPWGAWITPLFWWLSLAAAVCFASLCVVVTLRKQWIENERLLFPLMEVPIEIVRVRSNAGSAKSFISSPLFWIGFSISAGRILWNMASYFIPGFPTINRDLGVLRFGRDFPPIYTNVYFIIIGFAYLINLDISFSIWFFYLLSVFELAFFNRIGLNIGRTHLAYGDAAATAWQGFGGLSVIVLWGLWMARRHLRDVAKKALNKNYPIDDSQELLSYRTAFWGLIASTLYIGTWLHRSGMSFVVLILFMLAGLIIYLGITRVVVETGLIGYRGPILAQTFCTFSLGAANIPTQSMVALAMAYGWFSDLKSFVMPGLANSVKLFDTIRTDKRSILFAIVVALAAGIVITTWFQIYTGYQTGAFNYGGIYGWLARVPYDDVVGKIRNPADPDLMRMGFMAAGVILTGSLTFLRYRFPWWPLNPLGIAIAPAYPVSRIVFAIFLAWGAKSIILLLGGIRLYRRAKPFFFGLIMGYFVGAGVSWIIDMIFFPGEGHSLSLY